MITEEEIIRRLEYLEMMNNNMAKYGGCEGKVAWTGIYPKTNKARIDLVKDDELYAKLFFIYFIIRVFRDDSMRIRFNLDEGIIDKVISECCGSYDISTTWAIECIVETALNDPDFLDHVATRHEWRSLNDDYY